MEAKKIVSLLADSVNVEGIDGFITTFNPSGTVVGCKKYEKVLSTLTCEDPISGELSFNVLNEKFTDPDELPAPCDGTIYIVSKFLFNVLDGSRKDIVTLGELVVNPCGTMHYRGFVNK